MRNYITAAMSTANQVADTVNVDTTTVVRCAQALGYSGWPELQDQLKAHALAEFHATNGAGIQNYIDALHAWLRYVGLNSQSAQHPSNTNLAIDAACAYAEAIHRTDHCLGYPDNS
jgi:DNA-binding MurR/RpiR family transcriptional regulator